MFAVAYMMAWSELPLMAVWQVLASPVARLSPIGRSRQAIDDRLHGTSDANGGLHSSVGQFACLVAIQL